MATADSPDRPAPAGIDTSTAHAARVYDFLLDGKDNYAADRAVAAGLLQVLPEAREMARRNRAFIGRAIRHVVGELGIVQIVDIGAGIPTAPAVHEIARDVDPAVRVVYVDNDPIVLAHDGALLAQEPDVRTVLGDVTTPEKILGAPELDGLIDWSQPVALVFAALWHFVPDEAEPLAIMATFRERLAPGSAVVVSMVSSHAVPADMIARGTAVYAQSANPLTIRTKAEVERFFAGFRVLEPGVVPVDDWRPSPLDDAAGTQVGLCGVGVLDA